MVSVAKLVKAPDCGSGNYVGSIPTTYPRKIAAWPVRIGAVYAKVLSPENGVRIFKTTGNCKAQGTNKVGIQRAEPGSTPDVRRQITIYF